MGTKLLWFGVFYCMALVCSFVATAISKFIGKKTGRKVPNLTYLALMFSVSALAGWVVGQIVRTLAETNQAGPLTQMVWLEVVAYAVTIYVSLRLVEIRGPLEKNTRAVVLLPWAAVLGILFASLFALNANAYARVDIIAARFRCRSSLTFMDRFARLYADERNGQLPESLNELGAFMAEEPNSPLLEQLISCPTVLRKGVSNARYEYDPRAPLGKHVPMIWDRQGNHPDGRNVLFADGNVEWLTEMDFQRIQMSASTE